MISKFGSFLVLVLSLSNSSFAEELDTFQYEGALLRNSESTKNRSQNTE
ncbi:hypothetical protein GOP98_18490 [Vibrio cholerae]|nr:hypothetical protein [Vibrio cholerae]